MPGGPSRLSCYLGQAVARIVELWAEGASLRQIAATLTAEGLAPVRGGAWHPQQVARVLDRAGVG